MVGPLEMETDSLVSTGETRHDQEKLKGHGNDGTSGKLNGHHSQHVQSPLICAVSSRRRLATHPGLHQISRPRNSLCRKDALA